MGENGAAATAAMVKSAVAIRQDDFALSVAGAAVVADSACPMSAGLTTLRLGRNNGALRLNVNVSLFPARLSNSDLVALTT